jgi:ComF family protein
MYQSLLDLWLFFFPASCLVCGTRLASPAEVLCFRCEYLMPLTHYASELKNMVSATFWGRVPVEEGVSLFSFEKGSAYQVLLHDLKYRGNRKAGYYLGRLLGHLLRHSSFSQCDLLIPVPLHPGRLRKRGYNQSEIIARGCSEILGIPVETRLLVRSGRHRSQTSKNRQERFENVSEEFALGKYSIKLDGLKVLLIDDVITTGATLEACSQVLLSQFSCQIYVAAVSSA